MFVLWLRLSGYHFKHKKNNEGFVMRSNKDIKVLYVR